MLFTKNSVQGTLPTTCDKGSVEAAKHWRKLKGSALLFSLTATSCCNSKTFPLWVLQKAITNCYSYYNIATTLTCNEPSCREGSFKASSDNNKKMVCIVHITKNPNGHRPIYCSHHNSYITATYQNIVHEYNNE